MKGVQSKTFRSVEDWKSAIMTLPEGSFFELLRSVFGNIKTPFNKQRLLDDLFGLLSRNEIKETIAAYIDENDRKLISATALLNEPVQEELEIFFAGEFSAAEIHAIIINLEERLIIYRFRDEDIFRLALNPVLEEVLTPFVVDTKLLFPSFPWNDSVPKQNLTGTTAFVSDCRLMAALFAYILDEEELFKSEIVNNSQITKSPGIRKKILDAAKKIFPGLDFELAVRTIVKLGLFRPGGRSLIPNPEKIADFGSISPVERQEYWAAGVYLCLRDSGQIEQPASAAHDGGFSPENLPFLSYWSNPRGIASLMHRFRSLLAPDRMYPDITLIRFCELLKREGDGTGYLWNSFLAVMEKTGLLKKAGDFWITADFPTEPAATNQAEKKPDEPDDPDDPKKPVIVMDAAFSIILYPEISFADALTLGAFCSVKQPTAVSKSQTSGQGDNADGTIARFELTRKSAVRGFDQGISAVAMLEHLNHLSGGRIDASLEWTLKEWENRYFGVSLHQGIILSLAEENRYLAEAGPVSSLIRKTLAPGIYLLSSGEKSEAVKALRKAGIDIVAQPPDSPVSSLIKHIRPGVFNLNSFPRLSSSGNPKLSLAVQNREDTNKNAESIKQNFRQVLEKMKLTKPERDELLARIERRLVLSEAQLEATTLRYEKLEARGLDYAGKSSIAKQAIETGSLLEITWPAQNGELNRTIGVPQILEKKEGESVLVLRAVASKAEGGNPEDAPRVIRIPLRKISLLRRIKQSIFGG